MPASFTHYAPQAMQRPDEKAPCRFCKPLSHSSKAENGLPRRRGKPLGRLLSRKGASRKWLNALSCSLYAFSHFVNHFLRPSALSLPVSRVLRKLTSHSFAQPNAIVRSLGAQMHSSGTEGSRREARSLSLLRVLKAAHAWCTAFCAGLSPLLRLYALWFQRVCGRIPRGSIY